MSPNKSNQQTTNAVTILLKGPDTTQYNIRYTIIIANMQTHKTAEFADQARSVYQEGAHLHLHRHCRKASKVISLGR